MCSGQIRHDAPWRSPGVSLLRSPQICPVLAQNGTVDGYPLFHTVTLEASYVSPLMAGYLGVSMSVQAQFDLDFLDAEIDPRIEADESAIEEQCRLPPANGSLSGVTGSSAHMDSQRTVEPIASVGSPWLTSSDTASSLKDCEPTSLYSQVDPCSVHTSAVYLGSAEHSRHELFPVSEVRMTSCLRGTRCKAAALRVSFSFEVQFWFPSSCQFLLPTRSVDVHRPKLTGGTVESARHVGFCPPVTPVTHCTSHQHASPSLTRHVGFRPSLHMPVTCHPFAYGADELRDVHAFTPSASEASPSQARHVGLRQPLNCPSISLDAEFRIFEDPVDGVLALPGSQTSQPTATDPYGDSSCRTLVDITSRVCNSTVLNVDLPLSANHSCKAPEDGPCSAENHVPHAYGEQLWPALRPHSKSQAARASPVDLDNESGAPQIGFGDAINSHDPSSPPADTELCVATSGDAGHLDPFSSFDSMRGSRVLNGQPGWQEQQYVSTAISTANLPGNPIGRVMRVETASHPSPQVILTQDHAGAFFRAVLFELGDVGGPLQVIDVTPLHTVDIALREALPHLIWAQLHDDLLQGRALSFVNRLPADAFVALPADADIVHILRDVSVTPALHVASAENGSVVPRPSPLQSYTGF